MRQRSRGNAKRIGESERERKIETERQRERQIDRQTDKLRETETERKRRVEGAFSLHHHTEQWSTYKRQNHSGTSRSHYTGTNPTSRKWERGDRTHDLLTRGLSRSDAGLIPCHETDCFRDSHLIFYHSTCGSADGKTPQAEI